MMGAGMGTSCAGSTGHIESTFDAAEIKHDRQTRLADGRLLSKPHIRPLFFGQYARMKANT
jgi:hypothetical protein